MQNPANTPGTIFCMKRQQEPEYISPFLPAALHIRNPVLPISGNRRKQPFPFSGHEITYEKNHAVLRSPVLPAFHIMDENGTMKPLHDMRQNTPAAYPRQWEHRRSTGSSNCRYAFQNIRCGSHSKTGRNSHSCPESRRIQPRDLPVFHFSAIFPIRISYWLKGINRIDIELVLGIAGEAIL